MGANFTFNEMLPTHAVEANGRHDARRQLEVFTHGGKNWLRLGAVNHQDSGVERYTVELPPVQLNDLIAGLEALRIGK